MPTCWLATTRLGGLKSHFVSPQRRQHCLTPPHPPAHPPLSPAGLHMRAPHPGDDYTRVLCVENVSNISLLTPTSTRGRIESYYTGRYLCGLGMQCCSSAGSGESIWSAAYSATRNNHPLRAPPLPLVPRASSLAGRRRTVPPVVCSAAAWLRGLDRLQTHREQQHFVK